MIRTIRTTLPAALFVCLATMLSAFGGDWLQFRGDGGQGIAPDTGLSTTWNDTENIIWKTQMPGPGASSPIILNGRVYLTCWSGYGLDRRNPGQMENLKLHVVCADAKSGEMQWDTVLEPTLPERDRVRDHGYAAATPATDGKALYVFFGKSGVFKISLDGKKVWQTKVGDGTHSWGSGTSPVLYENLVIVNASVESRSLVALDKHTGKQVWKQGGMKMSWNTPHLVEVPGGNRELVVSVKDKILAFDPATGKPLWECEGIHDYVCPSIVSHKGIVYAIGGRKSQAVAVRAGGRGNVTGSHRLWVANVGANVSSPVVHDGYLYWTSDHNTRSYCLKLEDGSVVYDEKAPAQPYASTLLADGKLYVVSRRGGTFVLPAEPSFRVLARNRFESDHSTCNASPAVANGRIYLRSDKTLYCIGNK